MLDNPKYLLCGLAITVIAVIYLAKELKRTRDLNNTLLKNERELQYFKGYRAEVEQLKNEILKSLPRGLEKVSTLWADLNTIFDLLNEEWERNSYQRRRKISDHIIIESAEVRELKKQVQENKKLKYRLEFCEAYLAYAMNVLNDKYGEAIDDVLIEQYLDDVRQQYKAEEKKQTEQISKLIEQKKKVENEIYNLYNKKDRLKRDIEVEKAMIERDVNFQSLKVQKKRVESEITSLLNTFDIRIEEAKRKIERETDTPKVLKSVVNSWVMYKGILWEEQLYAKFKGKKIDYATVEELKESLRGFKKKMRGAKEIEYKYNYILSLFPDLEKYVDSDATQEYIEEEKIEYTDKRQVYLSKEEWEKLSETEKSQRALDNYNERRRLTNAQVGRDYEEYIAHLFREKLGGCHITMFGEQRGLADLGRDLIVRDKTKVYIVQCKRWSSDKIIREKHIMQLFGTTIEYCWEMKKKDIHPLDVIGKSVIPVFVATTELSPTANRFAERLGVIVHKVPMGDYPQIKCNIGKEGERIYHLPFDQQYNSTLIEHQRGEFMAWTVEEAEKNGFRRALRHYIS
jgi:hypothetical protein